MIIVICDVCGNRPPGRCHTYAVGERTFDVCGSCEDRPFAVPPKQYATVVLTASPALARGGANGEGT